MVLQVFKLVKIDFLRHIVNPILSEYSELWREHVEGAKSLIQVLDEVRQLLYRAEYTYNFGIYGGDLKGLAEYLLSKDFDIVVSVLKSVKATEVAEKILEEAIKKYSGYTVVVEACKRRLSELRSQEAYPQFTEDDWIKAVETIRKEVENTVPKAHIAIGKEAVSIKTNSLEFLITKTKEGLKLDARISISKEYKSLSELIEYLNKFIKAFH